MLAVAFERLAQNADYIAESVGLFKDYIETHYRFPAEFGALGISGNDNNEVHLFVDSPLNDYSHAYMEMSHDGIISFGCSIGKSYKKNFISFELGKVPERREISKVVTAVVKDKHGGISVIAEHWYNKVFKLLDNIERGRGVLSHRAEIARGFAPLA